MARSSSAGLAPNQEADLLPRKAASGLVGSSSIADTVGVAILAHRARTRPCDVAPVCRVAGVDILFRDERQEERAGEKTDETDHKS